MINKIQSIIWNPNKVISLEWKHNKFYQIIYIL